MVYETGGACSTNEMKYIHKIVVAKPEETGPPYVNIVGKQA
jgi:hypothetical protein